jgi:hypothetical protein
MKCVKRWTPGMVWSIGAVPVAQFDRHFHLVQVDHQRRHRKAMARIHADHAQFFGRHLAQLRFQLGRQAFQGRGQARRDAAVGPHQLLRQRRELRAASTAFFEQAFAEQPFCFAQQSPGVAVGQLDCFCSLRDRAGVLHGQQQSKQGAGIQRRLGMEADLPVRADVNA